MKQLILFALLLLPMLAYAHGEEILVMLQIDLLVFIVVIIGILFLKWRIEGKVLLIICYIFSIILTFICTSNLSYNEHSIFLNTTNIGVPLLITLIFFRLLKNKMRK